MIPAEHTQLSSMLKIHFSRHVGVFVPVLEKPAGWQGLWLTMIDWEWWLLDLGRRCCGRQRRYLEPSSIVNNI